MRNSSNIQNARSLRRQRTTPWIAGIGPLSTIRASARRRAAKPFIGFGDPRLEGDPSGTRGVNFAALVGGR